MYNIQNNYNLNDLYVEIDTLKAKILKFIERQNNKGLEAFKKALHNLGAHGKRFKVKELNPHIKELEEEKAIINNNNILSLTEKGHKLLESNKHLLKKFQPDIKKTRCDKAVPSEEDIAIINYILNLKNIETIQLKDIVEDLKVSRQLVTRRLKKLKDSGYLNFTPRKYNTLTVTEKGNRLIN